MAAHHAAIWIKPYLNPEAVRRFADRLLVVGVFWVIAAAVYMINAATQTQGYVEIDVVAQQQLQDNLTTVLKDSIGSETWLRVAPAMTPVEFEVAVEDSTMAEQLLSRGGVGLTGLAVLLAALLLRPVLLSVADGEPFRSGNARRLVLLAVLITGAAFVAQIPGLLATGAVLDRLGRGDAAALIGVPDLDIPINAALASFALLVVAEAFRRGLMLADDVDGLV